MAIDLKELLERNPDCKVGNAVRKLIESLGGKEPHARGALKLNGQFVPQVFVLKVPRFGKYQVGVGKSGMVNVQKETKD